MHPEIKELLDSLKKEILAVSAILAQKQADSPRSHWTQFCSSCVFVGFYQDPGRRQTAFSNALQSFENSKSEVRESGLEVTVFDRVETALTKLGECVNKLSDEASQPSAQGMKR